MVGPKHEPRRKPKHPHGVRPLTQTGLLRIPKSPLQRMVIAGAPEKRDTLDRVNERHAKHGWTLHPTKGWRRISDKRTSAERINNAARSRRIPYSLKLIKKWLRLVGGR